MIGPSDTPRKTPFHPTFVNNMKNFIPLILDQTVGHYVSWVEFLQIQACAYDALDHINPKTPRPASIDEATWDRLDAIVKQWIYATISPELAQIILNPNATSQDIWT